MSLLKLLRYSIDTSAILDSWVRWHPPDSFPSLWNNIEKMINDGTLRATEEVKEELSKKDDDVYKWAKDRDNLFIPLTPDIQIAASDILSKFPKLVGAMNERSQADVFVIALAMIENCTVITGEQYGIENKPKIPFVCNFYKIPCINMVGFIREQNWKF
jgi:hypothetical protein